MYFDVSNKQNLQNNDIQHLKKNKKTLYPDFIHEEVWNYTCSCVTATMGG